MEHLLQSLILSALPILIAITFHEVAHGLVAYRLGDGTAKAMGRLTLNPIAHIDLLGTIIMPIALYVLTNGNFVFGYAKPVPINPYNFRNPRKGMAISAAAGPIMNFVLALISMLLISFVLLPLEGLLPPEAAGRVLAPVLVMLIASIKINALLAALNLVPVPPLDGGRVAVGLLPRKQAYAYSKIEPFGLLVIIILLSTRLAYLFITPLASLIISVVRIFDVAGVLRGPF
jgi:Zn-dependent protease